MSDLHIIFSHILYFSSFTVLLLEAGCYFTFCCKKITRKGQMVGVAYLEAVLWVALLYHDRLPTIEKGTLKHRLQKLSTFLVPQTVKRTTTTKQPTNKNKAEKIHHPSMNTCWRSALLRYDIPQEFHLKKISCHNYSMLTLCRLMVL